MKNYLPLLITILLIQQNVVAQTLPLLSQIQYAQHIYNPAYAVLKSKPEVYYMNRSQWTGIPDAPTTSTITFAVPLKKDMAGLGGYLTRDKIGLFSNNSGRLDFSYRIKVIDSVKLYVGLGGGFTSTTIDYNIVGGSMVQYTRFKAIAGILLNWKELNIGISVPQLFTNELTTTPNYSRNPNIVYRDIRHFIGTLDYNINLENNFNIKTIYTIQKGGKGTAYLHSINTIVTYKKDYWASFGFRNEYGLTLGIGLLLLKHFTFGYGYEFNFGNIKNYAGQTHEVILGYRFGKKSK